MHLLCHYLQKDLQKEFRNPPGFCNKTALRMWNYSLMKNTYMTILMICIWSLILFISSQMNK